MNNSTLFKFSERYLSMIPFCFIALFRNLALANPQHKTAPLITLRYPKFPSPLRKTPRCYSTWRRNSEVAKFCPRNNSSTMTAKCSVTTVISTTGHSLLPTSWPTTPSRSSKSIPKMTVMTPSPSYWPAESSPATPRSSSPARPSSATTTSPAMRSSPIALSTCSDIS